MKDCSEGLFLKDCSEGLFWKDCSGRIVLEGLFLKDCSGRIVLEGAEDPLDGCSGLRHSWVCCYLVGFNWFQSSCSAVSCELPGTLLVDFVVMEMDFRTF